MWATDRSSDLVVGVGLGGLCGEQFGKRWWALFRGFSVEDAGLRSVEVEKGFHRGFVPL